MIVAFTDIDGLFFCCPTDIQCWIEKKAGVRVLVVNGEENILARNSIVRVFNDHSPDPIAEYRIDK